MEFVECLIDGQNVELLILKVAVDLLQNDAFTGSQAFGTRAIARIVNQDGSHCRCRRCEEVLTICEGWRLVAKQLQENLVDQVRWLQGRRSVAGGDHFRCQLPELRMDKAEEVVQGVGATGLDGLQQSAGVAGVVRLPDPRVA